VNFLQSASDGASIRGNQGPTRILPRGGAGVGEAEQPSQVSVATGAMSFPERISRIAPAKKQLLAAAAGVAGALLLVGMIGIGAVLVGTPARQASAGGTSVVTVATDTAATATAAAPGEAPIERGVITGVVPSTPASASTIEPPNVAQPASTASRGDGARVPEKPRVRAPMPAPAPTPVRVTRPKKSDIGF
jgi:hypothetical protein